MLTCLVGYDIAYVYNMIIRYYLVVARERERDGIPTLHPSFTHHVANSSGPPPRLNLGPLSPYLHLICGEAFVSNYKLQISFKLQVPMSSDFLGILHPRDKENKGKEREALVYCK